MKAAGQFTIQNNQAALDLKLERSSTSLGHEIADTLTVWAYRNDQGDQACHHLAFTNIQAVRKSWSSLCCGNSLSRHDRLQGPNVVRPSLAKVEYPFHPQFHLVRKSLATYSSRGLLDHQLESVPYGQNHVPRRRQHRLCQKRPRGLSAHRFPPRRPDRVVRYRCPAAPGIPDDAGDAEREHQPERATIAAHLGAANRRAALRGADYVVNAIQVGGYQPSTVIDFEIPKKYGLRQTIADTLGVGGIFRTLRTVPRCCSSSPAISRWSAPPPGC